MRIQAVVTPSSPEPPTSFSDQVGPIYSRYPYFLILTHRLVIRSLVINSRLLTIKALSVKDQTLFCLNQTGRWKVESLSPDVEISVFTMYSENGFFHTC